MRRLVPLALAVLGSFAAVSVIAPGFATTRIPPQRAKGDRELGQYLSSECVTCHQVSGKYDGIPPIVGWPEDVFVEIMSEYRSDKRENPVMRTIVARLSDDDIAALAAYFQSLPEQTGPK